ncbi:S41 family peptidase [Abyssibacter sp.]|uniref:S41 family peptidase n=1 Tax=Abyssibacter sp. TaxID=2320200 RepID=UPI003511A44A
MNRFLYLLAVATLAACGGGGSSGPSDCGVVGQNSYVYDELRDSYLWADFVADGADPADYASPSALLQDLKHSLDQTRFGGSYSYVADQAEFTSLLNEGEFTGLGVRLGFTDADELTALLVFSGSPAANAGLERGTRILRIDGQVPSSDPDQPNYFDSLLGADEAGVTVELEIQDPDAAQSRVVSVTKAVVTIDSVQNAQVFETPGGMTVGYLLFTNFFTEISRDALRDAFSDFSAAGVDELIVDLRYNGGGSVRTSTVLGSLIAGGPVINSGNNEIFTDATANDDHPELGFIERFFDETQALDLGRVVVIGTQSTASASELVINGLEPFLDVVLVGSTTFGKPVGQHPMDFCDKTLVAVTFQTLNADGQGDYFDGIAPDCVADDDWSEPLSLDANAGNEASIQTALDVITTGQCPAVTKRGSSSRSEYLSGVRGLIGAH